MVLYQKIKCIKTDKGTWINELTKEEFATFNDCTKFIDNYLDRKVIINASVIALFVAIVLIAYIFFMR